MTQPVLKQVFTTVEAARHCHVSHATLFRAAQQGKIKTFKTPGGHFRIHRAHLSEYLVQMGMEPLDAAPKAKVLLVGVPGMGRALARNEVVNLKRAANAVEAGFWTGRFEPDVVVLEAALCGGRDAGTAAFIKSLQPKTRILAVTSEANQAAAWRSAGAQISSSEESAAETLQSWLSHS